jgi:hypothetical protein
MKRALVPVVTFAILGAGCGSGSNPTPPAHLDPVDSGTGERTPVVIPPDTRPAGTPDVPIGATKDGPDAPLSSDGIPGLDVGPPARVTVAIQSLVASSADGGPIGSPDGGAGPIPVYARSDRLAPTVRVLIEPLGGDPTGDVVVSVSSTLTQAGASSPAARISLNQTDYAVAGLTKSYGYSDTPFDLAKLATGLYTLTVTAVTAAGATGTASTVVYIDGGPAIMFLSPNDGVSLRGSVLATVVVLDDHAGVASVSFSVGQVPISAEHITSNGAQYTVTLDFGSFNPPLDGPQVLTVTAVNGNGVVAIAARRFIVDNQGPVIADTKPSTGGLIGRLITIEAKVDDPAGVMESSVVAVVAHGDVHFEVHLEKGTDGVYRRLFDTTQLPSYALFPSISFRAQDVLGNQSSVGYLVSLDNTPPVLDLDPPDQVRLVKSTGACSWEFDPVGPDAIDDGSIVNQLFDVRARIEDEGNTPRTGVPDFVPIAGVDPTTTKVLILDDTSLPLTVDTSDPPDGICDDINPELVPSVAPQSARDAQLLDLVPINAKSGSADFTEEPGVPCTGDATVKPRPLCDTTYSFEKNAVMYYALGYAGNQPSIWTLPPVVGDGLQCAGRQFDSSNNLHDGWACVAVIASDKLGNTQVSRPLRICVAATPNSTACSGAAHGGQRLESVLMPASATGKVIIVTKDVVTGLTGAPLVDGDVIQIVNPTPTPIRPLMGEHKVTPTGTAGTQFILNEATPVVYDLWADPLDGTDAVLKGPVAVLLNNGANVQVLTESPATQLPPDFNGAVTLTEHGLPPSPGNAWYYVDDLMPTGFALPATSGKLGGFVILSAKLPNCTGTVFKSPTGGITVDASKRCKPWAAYPPVEWVEID